MQGKVVELVPVAREHVERLREILQTPEVAARWPQEHIDSTWPFDDSAAKRFAILVEGAVRGMVQYAEQQEPAYRHASIDIFLDPAVHGRGIGRDAVSTLARFIIEERKHHRLVIDPAADNQPAIQLLRSGRVSARRDHAPVRAERRRRGVA